MTQSAATEQETPRVYDDEGHLLMEADKRADRIILLPSGDPREAGERKDRIRIQWGHHLLSDLMARRYRTLICGVNPVDNSHGIISQLAELLPTSQWNSASITSYAQTFARSTGEQDLLVLKYDMDAVEVMALLRPQGKDALTLDDLHRGFQKITEMLDGRTDRQPVASVSFLGAKSNKLLGPDSHEPSFETVLRIMYDAGYRGDIYPSLGMWELAPTGVFASYPFPASLDDMRRGGF